MDKEKTYKYFVFFHYETEEGWGYGNSIIGNIPKIKNRKDIENIQNMILQKVENIKTVILQNFILIEEE